MEIFLNLVWAALALAGVSYWSCTQRRKCAEQGSPLVALAMLVVILFPVISVSDDLWSIQNPAETDTTQRRIQVVPDSSPNFSASWALPELDVPPIRFEFIGIEIPRFQATCGIASVMTSATENRPPPVS